MDNYLSRTSDQDLNNFRNRLSKNDFLNIGTFMSTHTQGLFSLQEPAKIQFTYRHNGFVSKCSSEEFKKTFSSSTDFTELSIMAFVPKNHSYLTFNTNNNSFGNMSVSMRSHCHTAPEIEDALEDFLKYIRTLLLPYLQNPTVTVSLQKQSPSQTENNKIQQKHVTDTSNPANTSSNPSTPFYKNGVFWGAVGGIAGIGGLIVAVIQLL